MRQIEAILLKDEIWRSKVKPTFHQGRPKVSAFVSDCMELPIITHKQAFVSCYFYLFHPSIKDIYMLS